MLLRPQDLLVALKIAALGDAVLPARQLASEVGISPAETGAALRRALRAQLVVPRHAPRPAASRARGRPPLDVVANRAALIELAVHGARYVFVPERGGSSRGVPTAHGANPLRQHLTSEGSGPVWPDPRGEARGESLSPIYPSAVTAAKRDAVLYMLLALLDALRAGSARERGLAGELFKQVIHGKLHG